MQAERSRMIDNSVPMEEGKYPWSGEFCGESANGFFHGGSKAERGSFFLSRAVIGRKRLAVMGRNLR